MFKAWLFSKKPVLRSGFTYRLTLPQHDSDVGDVFHEYTMTFSEPVTQGYALSTITEISVSLYHNPHPGQQILGKVETGFEDEDYIEIDQNFMANSVLPSIGYVLHLNPFTSTYTAALFRLDPDFLQTCIHAFRWHPQRRLSTK